MKKILFALLACFLISFFGSKCNGQIQLSPNDFKIKRFQLSAPASFLTGFAKGTVDVLRHHHSTSIFSNSNPTSFFGNESWKRKYKNGDPEQGAKFLGSSTFLVFTTDGFHLSEMVRNRVGLAIPFLHVRSGNRKHLIDWVDLVDFLILNVFYQSGFYLSQIILRK